MLLAHTHTHARVRAHTHTRSRSHTDEVTAYSSAEFVAYFTSCITQRNQEINFKCFVVWIYYTNLFSYKLEVMVLNVW
jgi:hypothetical protein